MSINIKKGFSLVEVMILFAFLSLILAASIPMISKKTTAIPKKTPHGVYICIANADGATQELYNSSNLLGSSSNMGSHTCTFNVPNANEYKVELYSAGAGGTEYAAITTGNTNSATGRINRDTLWVYNLSRNIRDVLGNEIAYIPQNNDFVRAFQDLTVRLTNNTGSGGDGGRARLYYKSPADTRCRPPLAPLNPDTQWIPVMPIYSEKTNLMLDNTGNVSKQYDDYCKYDEAYGVNYYNSQDWIARNLPATYTHGNYRNISQNGGRGGSEKRIGLDFKILAEEGGSAYYRNIDNNYPFLIYLSDLLNNSYGHGYFAARCNVEDASEDISFVSDSCSLGTPSNGTNGDPVTSYGETYMEDDGIYKKLIASSGDDVDSYAAFRIPRFTGALQGIAGITGTPNYNNNNGIFLTIQKTIATGGQGGIVGYQHSSDTSHPDFRIYSNYETHVPPNTLTNYAWRVFAGSYPFNNEIENGQDATLYNNVLSDQNNLTGQGWKYYRIYSNNVPASDQIPSAEITSELSRKNYSVGNPGENGMHRIYHTTTLGTRCTINVPPGGPILRMNDYNNDQLVQQYENSLEVSIQCVDADNHTVFLQRLNGARYNRNLSQSTYTWSRDNAADNTLIGLSHTANANEPDLMQYVRPRWSRVFNNIHSLNNSSVAQGGQGTSVIDRCSAPKGFFLMQVILNNLVLNGRTVRFEHDGRWPDDYYQCYPASGQTRDIQEIRSAINHYDINEATAGGPGAVVITW